MVDLEPLERRRRDARCGELIARHVALTGSALARALLWPTGPTIRAQFVKVMPRDYKRVLAGRGRRRAPRAATPAFAELVGVANG